MKRMVSLLLAILTAASCTALLAGCSDQEYPVEVANYKIEKEPKTIVVLDDIVADIMAYMHFTEKISGRSDAVDQPDLAKIPSVGSESAPDVKKIAALDPDFVFCNEKLGKDAEAKLEDEDIRVIKLQTPSTKAEIKTSYETIGKILAGQTEGRRVGKSSYVNLEMELEKQEREVVDYDGGKTRRTVCYLYLKDNKLAALADDTYGNTLLSYTNSINIFSDPTKIYGTAPEDIIKHAAAINPDCIFYDSEATFKVIKENATLAKLKAVKDSSLNVAVPMKEMSRPGITAPLTLSNLIFFMHNGKLKYDYAPASTAAAETTAPPATTKAAEKETTTAPASSGSTEPAASSTAAPTDASAASTAATGAQDVSAEYKITIKDLSLKKSDSNDNVRVMQQRLFDLGYITKNGNDTNITGYYGDVTEVAVKAFQKNNGISETGTADNDTLKAMFLSSAKKA